MHSAIFVVKMTKQLIVQEWEDKFLPEVAKKLQNEKGAKRLGENVWLLDCQQSIRALAWLVATADRLGLPYGILRLESEPQWLPADFDPNTN